ncbi:MAG: hypothetical protein M9897_09225 [Brumimicrobium sp.]|nr:hypothetical protein [Brumimicrobium sp.]
MKQLKQLSLLSSSLCLVLILLACKKDKTPSYPILNNNETPCESFNWGQEIITQDEYYGDTSYFEPCFSPYTDDEFIYVRRISGKPLELVKHTISTKNDEVLCTSSDTGGLPLGSPDWGKQGKIIFNVGTGSSGIGYMINDDGSGLHQFLPSNVSFTEPKFNGQGDKIVAGGKTLSSTHSPIYNLFGEVVDSFAFRIQSNKYGVGGPLWTNGEFIDGLLSYIDFSKSPFEKGLCYLQSDTIVNSILITNNPNGYAVTDVDKHQNLIYYVIYGLGFYQYNETTGSTKLLQEMCDTRKILHISVSQFSGNILIEEMHNSKLSEAGGVLIQPNIYLLNPYTMQKTPILVKK